MKIQILKGINLYIDFTICDEAVGKNIFLLYACKISISLFSAI